MVPKVLSTDEDVFPDASVEETLKWYMVFLMRPESWTEWAVDSPVAEAVVPYEEVRPYSTLEVDGSLVVQEMVATPFVETPEAWTSDMTGAVTSAVVLETLTDMAKEVFRLPAASLAVAVREWEPFATPVVSHWPEYGAVVSSEPRLTLSSLNWTPMTPTLSEAEAAIWAVFDMVAPLPGAVMETAGRVVSLGVMGVCEEADVVKVLSRDAARLPAASLDFTR